MKTTKLILAMTIVAMCAACGGPKKDAQKVLVLYYSQTGNTKVVAEEIAGRLGADIEEIVMVNPYDTGFAATIERCKEEQAQGITPEIQPVQADLSQYDLIFIGFPVWFGTYAPPVATWLNSVDLSGKKVALFCTFGSGGIESSYGAFTDCQPNAEVLGCYGVRAARLDAVPDEVEQFLIYHHLIEGELKNVEPWGPEHDVTAEEAAIFDEAVGDYPMIHARAVRVSSHPVEGGIEYNFLAENIKEDGQPEFPGANRIGVWVIALDGQAPVFTRVVR